MHRSNDVKVKEILLDIHKNSFHNRKLRFMIFVSLVSFKHWFLQLYQLIIQY